MLDPKKIEEFCNRLNDLVAASPAADLERNMRALLAGFFAKLDLISRDEFEIQAGILQHTQEKLRQLEERINKLENPETNKSQG